MLQADILGKLSVPEDVLTSSCFGLLRLLPDKFLIKLLARSRLYSGSKLNWHVFDIIDDFEFWPWVHGAGIPDVVTTLKSSSNSIAAKIIIEVKHGAGKSGGNEDQLARYYSAFVNQNNGFQVALVYLTHHRDLPKDDLEATLESPLLTDGAVIYWLSWYTVAQSICEQLNELDTSTDRRILSTLHDYLSLKGYKRFNKLDIEPWEPAIGTVYRHHYALVDYNFGLSLHQCFSRNYTYSAFSLLSNLYTSRVH